MSLDSTDASRRERTPAEEDQDALVAEALAEAVRVGGHDLVGEPRRVQGMVNDVLGPAARTRRAEIDAVVLAAEESIPEDLLADQIDADDALDRLRDRGLDREVASFAVEVWRYALGMLAADAPAPSLTNSLRVSSGPPMTDAASDELDIAVGESIVIDEAVRAAAAHHSGTDDVATATSAHLTPTAESGSKRGWIVAGAAAAVVALVAGVLVFSGGDTTTDTEVLAAESPVALEFPVEKTPLGDLARTWTVDDGELVGEVSVVNHGGENTTGRHHEVVPKGIAATADLITSEPAHIVVKNDPVIAWDVTIEPDQTLELTYRVDVADDTDLDDLEKWQDDHRTESDAFTAEIGAAPTLTVSTADGTVGLPEVQVDGTVDASATLTINGSTIPVGDGGAFSYLVTGLVPGANPLTIAATSTHGTTATHVLNVTYQPPPADQQASQGNGGPAVGGDDPITSPLPSTPRRVPTTTQPPPGDPGVTIPQPPPTSPVTPTTAPPPPPAKPTVSINGPRTMGACTAGSFSAATTNSTGGYWTHPMGRADGQHLRIYFEDNTVNYTTWVTYTATGPGGETTERINITITPYPYPEVLYPENCRAMAG